MNTTHPATFTPQTHTPGLDRFVLMVAIIAPFTNIPQILKIYVQGNAEASLISWMLFALFSVPLIVYGVVHREKVIMFNASLNFVMQVTVCVGIVVYSIF